MQIVSCLDDLPYIADGVMTIGFFDGFHLGHRKIIDRIKAYSRHVVNRKKIVFTFSNHPIEVIHPERSPSFIQESNFKKTFLKKNEIDYLVMPTFTEEFAQISAKDFLSRVTRKFGFLKLILGDNFRFGYKNLGNIDLIRNFVIDHPRFDLEVIYPVRYHHKIISSTLIRGWVKEGRFSDAAKVLNREFFIENVVFQGERKGSKIGYPTANIEIPEKQIVPRYGVYSGFVEIEDEKFKALIYVGTLKIKKNLKTPAVEAHIIDFDRDIYERKIRVYFSKWIREPVKIENLDQLKDLLEKDKKYL